MQKYALALKTDHIQTGPSVSKASQCTGLHTAGVLTKRYLQTGICIVITPTLSVLVFGVIIHQVVFDTMSTFAYNFGTFV